MRPFPPELLHELLHLDLETGRLFWKERPLSFFEERPSGRSAEWRQARWNSRHAGKPALTSRNDEGYLGGCILWRVFRAHVVVFAMVHGRWPVGQIDHRNGVRDDNRPSNLREVTNRQNARNQRRFKNNTSGVAGVVWNKAEKRWKARINDDQGRRNLGTFKCFGEAVAARRNAEAELNYSPLHGRR